MKSAVLRRALGEAPVFNPKYLDFANHMGFRIVPYNVGKGNEKGRVENAVGYVKKNFLIATVSQVRASRQFRITLDSNRLGYVCVACCSMIL